MKRILLFLIIVLSINLIGCTKASGNKTVNNPTDKVNIKDIDSKNKEEGEDMDIEYKLVKPEEIDNLILSAAAMLKVSKGYYIFNSKNSNLSEGEEILFISLGKKPSSGYSLEIKSIKLEKDTLKFIVKEKEPEPNKSYNDVITYPYILIKFKNEDKSIKVLNTYNKEYQMLNLNTKSSGNNFPYEVM